MSIIEQCDRIMAFVAVADTPDNVDDVIACARANAPGFRIGQVGAAWIERGPDRGKLFVSVQLIEDTKQPSTLN